MASVIIGQPSDGGGGVGPSPSPLVLNADGSVLPKSMNGLADSLDASGLSNGTMTFSAYGKPGVYPNVVLFGGMPGSVGGNAYTTFVTSISRYSFWYDNGSGSAPGVSPIEFVVPYSDGDAYQNAANMATAINSALGAEGVSASSVNDGVTIQIPAFSIYQDPSDPNAIPLGATQNGDPSGATRRASITSLLGKGWNLTNYI